MHSVREAVRWEMDADWFHVTRRSPRGLKWQGKKKRKERDSVS